ncbi:MAG: hypothetical protein NTX04_09985 [Verrucomicrobia bacterium]|nr:hypothetical protein [Verrucomicrobiota bacterium]
MKHGITEKLEALVIKVALLGFVAKAWVSQSLSEEQWVAKFIVEALLKWIHFLKGRQFLSH